MAELLLKSGQLATRADYEQSDIVKQMIGEAKKDAAPARDEILKSLTLKDIESPVVQALMQAEVETAVKKGLEGKTTREEVLRALTKEDCQKLTVVQDMIAEETKGAKMAENFIKTIGVVIGGKGGVAGNDDHTEPSLSRRHREALKAGIA